MWGSYYNIPKAIFYLLEGEYNLFLAILSSQETSLPEEEIRPTLNVVPSYNVGIFFVRGVGRFSIGGGD